MNAGILLILAIIFGFQLLIPKARLNKFGLFGVICLVFSGVFIFGFAIYQSWQQYFVWKNNELSRFFLPPYQNFDYFFFYIRTRFFNPHLFSLFFGLMFLWGAKILNKKYNERFFEPIEPYLLGTSIFLIGQPLWLFYLIILLSIFLIINFSFSISHFWFNKGVPRVSLYYLWLPAAIFTIIISKWLSAFPWWQVLIV